MSKRRFGVFRTEDGEYQYIIVDQNNNFVAKTYSLSEANLILSAPDLLEACKKLLDDDAVGCYCHTLTKKQKCSLCFTNETIAKAEGK
jgi:hypothetical protein